MKVNLELTYLIWFILGNGNEKIKYFRTISGSQCTWDTYSGKMCTWYICRLLSYMFLFLSGQSLLKLIQILVIFYAICMLHLSHLIRAKHVLFKLLHFSISFSFYSLNISFCNTGRFCLTIYIPLCLLSGHIRRYANITHSRDTSGVPENMKTF